MGSWMVLAKVVSAVCVTFFASRQGIDMTLAEDAVANPIKTHVVNTMPLNCIRLSNPEYRHG
jgi:hypothetical protein